jgi:hypothetical protein
VPYIFGMVKGGKRPMKASWCIWALLDTLTLASMLAQHAFNPMIAASTLGCWTVFALSFRYGKPGISPLDVVCLAAVAFGAALWVVFDDPALSLAASLSVTFIGSFPTFVSGLRTPQDEDRTAWRLYTLACIMAVASIPRWDFAEAAQPIVYLVIAGTMAFVLSDKKEALRLRAEWAGQ